ncbi:MAG: hypothetical protein ACUZ8H_00330 [Candidatus Anammoxibacter sp.]
MNRLNVDTFMREVDASLQEHFKGYNIAFQIRTSKSLKANVHLEENLFIALRYNARNERIDFALIHNNKRVFGYDNLKEWHYHPYTNPAKHIFCESPSIDKIVSDIKEVYEAVKAK